MWWRQEPLGAECIALGRFRDEHKELVVPHRQAELLGDSVVVGGGFVAGATGTVEAGTRVDTRSRDVAVVLTREGVAGATHVRCRRGSHKEREEGEEDGGEDLEVLHVCCTMPFLFLYVALGRKYKNEVYYY